jgi:hypothetical protein
MVRSLIAFIFLLSVCFQANSQVYKKYSELGLYGGVSYYLGDLNPAKQNKYLPSTGLRVSSPQEVFELLPEGSTLFVMNSNYLEEIKAMSKYLFNYVSIDHD